MRRPVLALVVPFALLAGAGCTSPAALDAGHGEGATIVIRPSLTMRSAPKGYGLQTLAEPLLTSQVKSVWIHVLSRDWDAVPTTETPLMRDGAPLVLRFDADETTLATTPVLITKLPYHRHYLLAAEAYDDTLENGGGSRISAVDSEDAEATSATSVDIADSCTATLDLDDASSPTIVALTITLRDVVFAGSVDTRGASEHATLTDSIVIPTIRVDHTAHSDSL